MADILIYRVPGKNTIELDGEFKEIDSLSSGSGFVVTSFKKDKIYSFDSGKGEGEMVLDAVDLMCISKEKYQKNASVFLNQIKNQNLYKAVFSRIKEVSFRTNARQLFHCLSEEYPQAFVYLISSPLFGTWVGATPEYLLSVDHEKSKTIALAGTMRSDDSEIWGAKEINEQEYVCSFIRDRLAQLNIESVNEKEKKELIAGPVKHLATTFTFSNQGVGIADLVDVLHPTPAVSGLPQRESIALIDELEKHERSLYSGVIGVINEDDAQLFVNLRCAQLTADKAYLYLGGGFTADSDIDKEWIETENKARTLLNVLENL